MADVTTTAPPDPSDRCPMCEGTGRYQRPIFMQTPQGLIPTFEASACSLCRGTGLMSVAVTGGDAEPATVNTTEDE